MFAERSRGEVGHVLKDHRPGPDRGREKNKVQAIPSLFQLVSF
jgi:hypothetical protein